MRLGGESVARYGRLCAVAALAIVTASGCGARQDAAGSPRLTGTSPAPASSPPAAPPAPLTGESSQPEAERCTAAMLSGTVEPQDSSAGSRNVVLVVRNKSRQVCTLRGYGGLELLDAAREVLPTQAERTLRPEPAPVRLRPGAAAGKHLHWSVVPVGDEPADGPCQPTASAINVTPPDETTPLEVSFEFGSVCDRGKLATSAYFPK